MPPHSSHQCNTALPMQVRVRISHLLPLGASAEGGAAPSHAAPPSLRHASSAAPAGYCDDAPPADAASSSTAAALLHQPPTANHQPATSAMHVVAQLTSDGGDPLALEAQTSYANCQPTSSSSAAGAGTDSVGACMWGEMLTFCIKVVRGALYRSVPHELDCTASVLHSATPITPREHVDDAAVVHRIPCYLLKPHCNPPTVP